MVQFGQTSRCYAHRGAFLARRPFTRKTAFEVISSTLAAVFFVALAALCAKLLRDFHSLFLRLWGNPAQGERDSGGKAISFVGYWNGVRLGAECFPQGGTIGERSSAGQLAGIETLG